MIPWLIFGLIGTALAAKAKGGGLSIGEEMQNLDFTPPDERPNVLIRAMTEDQRPAHAPGVIRSVTPESVQPRPSLLYGVPLMGDDARPAIRPGSVLTTRQREGGY